MVGSGWEWAYPVQVQAEVQAAERRIGGKPSAGPKASQRASVNGHLAPRSKARADLGLESVERSLLAVDLWVPSRRDHGSMARRLGALPSGLFYCLPRVSRYTWGGHDLWLAWWLSKAQPYKGMRANPVGWRGTNVEERWVVYRGSFLQRNHEVELWSFTLSPASCTGCRSIGACSFGHCSIALVRSRRLDDGVGALRR